MYQENLNISQSLVKSRRKQFFLLETLTCLITFNHHRISKYFQTHQNHNITSVGAKVLPQMSKRTSQYFNQKDKDQEIISIKLLLRLIISDLLLKKVIVNQGRTWLVKQLITASKIWTPLPLWIKPNIPLLQQATQLQVGNQVNSKVEPKLQLLRSLG